MLPMFSRTKEFRRRGVSLLETLIYVTLVVFLMTAVLTTFLQLSDVYQKSRSKRLANQNGLAAIERLVREIRLAQGVDDGASVFGVHPGQLTLNTVVSSSNLTST